MPEVDDRSDKLRTESTHSHIRHSQSIVGASTERIGSMRTISEPELSDYSSIIAVVIVIVIVRLRG